MDVKDRTRRRPGRIGRALAASVVLSLLAGACGLGGEEPAATEEVRSHEFGSPMAEPLGDPVRGGEVTVAVEGENAGWLPGLNEMIPSFRNVPYAIYDPLVVVGEDGEHHPYLASAIEHDDSLTQWTVTLRPGVRFHDGTPLDAEVMKTIFDDFLMAPGSTANGLLDEVDELRVDGELTFTYVLSRPNGAFPYVLTGPVGWPFSPEAARLAGEDAGSSPIGTGPFRLESWQPNDRLVVVRNDDYWREGLPYLDRITFRPVPDEALRVGALLTGAVDGIQSLRGASIKEVLAAEESDVVAHTQEGDDASMAFFIVLEPPFDDLRVRRAAAQMYDPAIMTEILGDDGLVDPSTQFFGTDSPWYSERVADARPPYDPDAARQLVSAYVHDPDRSDGKPVGTPPEISFACLTEPVLIEVSQQVVEAAEAVGFSATLESVDTATLVRKLSGGPDDDPPFRGDFSSACFRAQHTGDPATTFGSAFGAPHAEVGNMSNYTHPELVGLINQLRGTADYDERFAIVEQIGIHINEAVPLTFVSGTPTMIGVRRDVKNVMGWTTPEGQPGDGIPFGVTRWGEVWIER